MYLLSASEGKRWSKTLLSAGMDHAKEERNARLTCWTDEDVDAYLLAMPLS